MSLFYIASAEVPKEGGDDGNTGFFATFQPMAVLVAATVIVAAMYMLFQRYSSYGRMGYQQVPNSHAQGLTV